MSLTSKIKPPLPDTTAPDLRTDTLTLLPPFMVAVDLKIYTSALPQHPPKKHRHAQPLVRANQILDASCKPALRIVCEVTEDGFEHQPRLRRGRMVEGVIAPKLRPIGKLFSC
jgi:hypothetical protein